MTKIKLGILSIGIVFALIACTNNMPQNANSNMASNANMSKTNTQPTPEPTKADMMAESRTLYEENCAFCHQASGDGGVIDSKKKKLKVPSLKKGKAATESDEKLISVITNGDEEMPAFKDSLSAEQIKSLVQFIRKEFQGK